MSDSRTIASVHADFPEWHRGRPCYAIWAIDVDGPAVRAACTDLAHHLAPFLLPGYRRQPHVTLHLCGFPRAVGEQADDFSPVALAGQLAALAGGAPEPFSIAIGTPATFTSAVYLGVADGEGGVARLRTALGGGGAAEGAFPYVPHVTVGLYRAAYPLAEVLAALAAWGRSTSLEVPVNRLTLLTYRSEDIAGPLQAVGDFDLASRHFAWREAGEAGFFGPCGDRASVANCNSL